MCVFCDIRDGIIPSYKLYEDEYVFVILDISQVTKGHSLVIVKEHTASLLTCDDTSLTRAILVAKQLGNHLMNSLNCQGMNVLSNINEVAGQCVDHLHIHLIPRYSKDDACVIQFKESEINDLAAILKQVTFIK